MSRIDTDAVEVQTVTSAGEVGQVLGLDMDDEQESARAERVFTVVDETDTVALELESSWWGNEAFGVWQEWFVVHPDSVSPSGKALFVREGISLNDPVGHLRTAEHRAESGNGWTSKAANRARRKALQNWGDDYMVGPGGGDGFDSRENFSDVSVPLSVIETAFATPADTDHLVVDAEGTHTGTMDEGDVKVVGTKDTRYGRKFRLAGDTYGAFKEDNVDEEITFHNDDGPDAHHTFDGDEWVCDVDGVHLVIDALVDAGYTVAVESDYTERVQKTLEESNSIADTFGVDL